MLFNTQLAMFFDIGFSVTGIFFVMMFISEEVEGSFSSGITTSLMENKSALWTGVESVYSLTDILFSKDESSPEDTPAYHQLLESPRFLVSKILTKLFICYLLHFTRGVWIPKYKIFGYLYVIYLICTMVIYAQFTYALIIEYHSIGKTTKEFFFDVWHTKEEMVEKVNFDPEKGSEELIMVSDESIFFLVAKLMSCLIILYVLEAYRRIWLQNFLVIGLLFGVCLLVMLCKCLYQLSNTLEHHVSSRSLLENT